VKPSLLLLAKATPELHQAVLTHQPAAELAPLLPPQVVLLLVLLCWLTLQRRQPRLSRQEAGCHLH
jgi:hypothetical protein